MQFEWDEAKNLENIRKHQIDFADVSAMFTEDMLIELDDRLDYGEERWMGIGFLAEVLNDSNNWWKMTPIQIKWR